jgi:hypothetical protein
MKILRSATAALAFTSTLTSAQTPPVQGPVPAVDIVVLLDLDNARANLVDSILENALQRIMAAREQIGPGTDEASLALMQAAMHAIRMNTDRQLAAVLTPEELARLKEGVPSSYAQSRHRLAM